MDDAEKRSKHYDEVGDCHGFTATFWSIYEVEDMYAQHAYPGATTLRFDSHPFWGKPSGIFEEPITGSRWVDLWQAANRIMTRCGDKHHVFIESFKPNSDGTVLTLDCGS